MVSLHHIFFRFCGSDIPPAFKSGGNRLEINFISDIYVNDRGFFAFYSAVVDLGGKFYAIFKGKFSHLNRHSNIKKALNVTLFIITRRHLSDLQLVIKA